MHGGALHKETGAKIPQRYCIPRSRELNMLLPYKRAIQRTPLAPRNELVHAGKIERKRSPGPPCAHHPWGGSCHLATPPTIPPLSHFLEICIFNQLQLMQILLVWDMRQGAEPADVIFILNLPQNTLLRCASESSQEAYGAPRVTGGSNLQL